jgi:hypothetical protein
MKKIEMVTMMTAAGKPFTMTEQDGIQHNASLADVISHFCHQLPMQQMTMLDATHGTRVVQASLQANGVLELEDADYSWLVSKVDEYAPRIYGINAVMLREALGPAENRERRRRAT